MATVLGGSDFTFAGLKDAPATVFLVLPPDRLASYARWLRLMVAQALTDWRARRVVHPGRCCSCSMSSRRSAVSNRSNARWG
jgi:type IV secretion system protein VirD4